MPNSASLNARIVLVVRTCVPVFAAVSFAGCTNAPGALRMGVNLEKSEIKPNEQLRIRVRLEAATRDPVCIWKDPEFDIAVRQDDKSPPIDVGRVRLAFCGTGGVMLLPLIVVLYPLKLCANLLDVGDAGGRFQLITDKQPVALVLAIRTTQTGAESGARTLYDARRDRSFIGHWPPGEYKLTVTLRNREADSDPPPLFWKPYDQKVQAETTFRVAPN